MTTRVLIRFYDENRRVVGVEEFVYGGETPGWNGSVETSPYEARSTTATVPSRATTMTFSFLTAGGDGLVGVIGLDGIEARIEPANGSKAISRRLFPLAGLPDAFDPLDTPDGWVRSGSKSEISAVRIRKDPTPHPILVLVDDDTGAFGNWEFIDPTAVHPGDKITLSWQSAHTLGSGESSANYASLSPGNYWFRVAAFRPNGEPLNVETSLPIAVLPPWFLRRDLWLAAIAVTAVGIAAGGRFVALRRMRRRIEEVERAHQLERERARIARDLHDEIGAALTEIAMQAAWVRRDMQDVASPETLELADGICHSAVDLVRSVDAIVWAVNPANDTLDRFAAYLIQSTEQFLDAAGLSMRFDVPPRLPPLPLDGAVRHRLFLVVREAINNAVKHAHASTLRLSLRLDSDQLLIAVEDDGRGFDSAATHPEMDHEGLKNMQHRMEEVGGTFSLTSGEGRGTRIVIGLPVTRQAVGGRVSAAGAAGMEEQHA